MPTINQLAGISQVSGGDQLPIYAPSNGAANLYGAPTTLAAQDFFRVRFYQATNSWYRIA